MAENSVTKTTVFGTVRMEISPEERKNGPHTSEGTIKWIEVLCFYVPINIGSIG